MAATAGIIAVLGGREALKGRRIEGPEDLRERVREGLPFAALEAVARTLELERPELTAALDLPERTLVRRKQERRLRPAESDRLVRLARVAAQAVEVLGDTERAVRWLHRPNRALGGPAPLTLLDTDIGAQQVEQLLGRIEHGVYS
ncbi:MAG TPA: antitoxin Xre/MbcA/ParS toxin-binding domain-containing protein [Thermoanaerobaculia bacterium]